MSEIVRLAQVELVAAVRVDVLAPRRGQVHELLFGHLCALDL